jgi:tRNA (guanine37-N1)-methyltransferase
LRKRLREKLASMLTADEVNHFYNAFDLVGDIAIIKASTSNLQNAETVGKQIMATHRKVKTVFAQTSRISGDFRVRELRFLAGENRATTKCRESGCTFLVDVEKTYFSPRLLHEHQRIARLVGGGEMVVNMFAGVGCFSVLIAKTVNDAKVYSIDVNPTAFGYMQENVRINRVFGKVFPMLGDSKDIVQTQLQGVADRVLMPLPEKALEYLPTAVSALKKSGGWIHLYLFEHAPGKEAPTEKSKLKVAQKLDSLGVSYTFALSRVVRSTGPNWYQTVIDVCVA